MKFEAGSFAALRMTVLVIAAACSRAGVAVEVDPHSPEAELATLKLHDGYEINLFASEKDGVVKPVQVRFDARGRLFVACIPSYPQPRPDERPDDRIVVLHDTDGDGRADQSGTFASGLSMPLGLEVGDGGVYATDGHDIVHLKDADNDGKADTKRPVLRGFFSGDSHQTVNSFVWGPAGEMIMCQGLHAFGRVETPWGVERLEKAGVWRWRPGRGRLDPFLGWDRGPQNPFGITFDDWGQPILVAGNGQGVYYLQPSMIRTSHFLDPKRIDDTKGAKFAGVDVIGTAAMPADAQGRMVAGSIMNNSVYWWTLEDNGSGFAAKNLPPLVTSTSTAFRIVDVKMGPDGAIYLADWYNPIIGHYQASLRHPLRDKTRGRIWRITAKGRPAVTSADMTKLHAAELFEQFKSPERWARTQAKRELADMPAEKATLAAKEWVSTLDSKGPQYDHLLMQAIGVYEAHDKVEPELLKRLIVAKDHRARAYAANVIGHWHDRLPDPVALLRTLAADEHPRVRLCAIVAASYVTTSPKSGAEAMAAALIAADRPTDRFINDALTQATHALKPHWKPALDDGRLELDGKVERLAALARADGTPDVLTALSARVKAGTLTGASRDSAVLLLAGVGGPAETAMVLTDPTVAREPKLLARALDAVAQNYRLRKKAPAGDVTGALRPLVEHGDAGVRRAAIGLAGTMKVEALRGAIERATTFDNAPAAVRGAAYEALADLGGDASKQKLRAAAIDASDNGGPNAADAWAAAITSYARLDLPDAARLAAGHIAAHDPPPTQTPQVVAAFLARQGGADALADAFAANGRLPKDAAKLALRAMGTAGRQDGKLWELLSKAAGNRGQKLPYDAELVKGLVVDAEKSGDPAAGRLVYLGAAANCASCHAINGDGGKIGPDLGPLGKGLPPDILVESVLWPNRQIKEGYNAIVVETKDGDVLQGYRVSEDKNEFVLRESGADEVTRIATADVKAKRDVGSVMPEGLTDGLTRKELVDLIAFLGTLGREKK